MKRFRVLIACECSGAVRDAFNACPGFDAVSCDLKPADDGRTDRHRQADVREILAEGWHLLIAHPPCTFLCNSGVGRLAHTPPNPSPGILYGPERWEAMRAGAAFFRLLLHADVPHVCLENPIMHGHAARLIGTKYAQTVQPYQFGEDASKRTALWLKGLPPLKITKHFPPRAVCRQCGDTRREEHAARLMFSNGCTRCHADAAEIMPRWSNQTDSGQNALTPSQDRGAVRSVTFPGIAEAMAAQWSAHLLNL